MRMLGGVIGVLIAAIAAIAIVFSIHYQVMGESATPYIGYASSGNEAAFPPEKAVVIPNKRGSFVATGIIGGVSIDFVVDTGASIIALTHQDAEKLGVLEGNGVIHVAQASGAEVECRKVILRNISVGPISLDNVEALVFPDLPGAKNLLGLSFLTRVRFAYDGQMLTLKALKNN